MIMLRFLLLAVLVAFGFSARAQTLNLPARASTAPTGSEFVNIISPLSRADREEAIYAQIANGNIPTWMRALVLISTNAVINSVNHTVSYYVTPDYMAIGTDTNYFLTPMTPLLAQRLANLLNCSLPTRRMVNDIWTKAPCKLSPSPISPSPAMTTVPVFDQHNTTVRGQRYAVTNQFPLGTLTGGDKKDVVIAIKIYTNFSNTNITKPVVIYGWHQTNGSPIQPLYNGHEETYADYSHGIRFVQMNITVDGAPNTVTNVLVNSSLQALLSDEGLFTKPWYTVAQSGSAIVTQPYSQTVNAGTNVTFSVVASGTPPFRYQWLFNGANILNATNATLILTNVQATNAGSYSVMVSNSSGTTLSIAAVLRVNTTSYPVLFADNFETNSSTLWNLFWGSGNGVADYTADWAFNYGTNTYTFNGVTNLIPPAPSSGGTTRGVRFTVNNNDANAFTAGVNIYPKNKSFSGNFLFKCEMWLNYPGGTGGTGTGVNGSTEHAIFGVNHLGTQANWAAASASSTDGLLFGVDGEGGTSRDYRAYVGNAGGVQTELIGSIASGLSESNNAAGVYPALFPANRFESSGCPGKNWVAVEIQQLNNVISWKLDGVVVAQRTNTTSFTSGDVMLGLMDTFTSIASPTRDSFVLFDNVRVEDLTGATNQPPVITTPPQNQNCSIGQNISFSVVAAGSAPLRYQWSFNGVPLNNATNTLLSLSDVQPSTAGQFSVVVSNAAGIASAEASLTVSSDQAQFTEVSQLSNNSIEMTFSGLEGEQYLLEASTNLVAWKLISVLPIANGPLSFTDPSASNFVSRYYRVRNSTSQMLSDFESFSPGTETMFQEPGFSASTTNHVDPAITTFAVVTNVFPSGNDSVQVLHAFWSFQTNTTAPWLRFTTFNSTNIPNPTIRFDQAVVFDMFTDKNLYVALGLRETSTSAAIGADGGTTGNIEWVGATNSTPPRGKFVAAGQWTNVQFPIPDEPVRSFVGNGVLQSSTGKGVLEHLAFVPATELGAYNVYLDNVRVVDLLP